MITNRAIADKVIETMREISGKINASVLMVRESCPDDEFQQYRRDAGIVMGEIFTVLAAIHAIHPDVCPEIFEGE